MLDELDTSATSHGAVTGPGEVIADAHRWMRSVSPSYLELDHPLTWVYERENSGHGTYVQDDKVYASVAGTLERVNKLVTVKPLRTRSAAAAATTSRDDLTEFFLFSFLTMALTRNQTDCHQVPRRSRRPRHRPDSRGESLLLLPQTDRPLTNDIF